MVVDILQDEFQNYLRSIGGHVLILIIAGELNINSSIRTIVSYTWITLCCLRSMGGHVLLSIIAGELNINSSTSTIV